MSAGAGGRPRDGALDEAATAAAIELTVEGGYHAMSMDRIAARAGVSKAALYRRWPNKQELFVEAVSRFARARLAVPDTGHARADLVEFLLAFVRDRRSDARTYEAVSTALAGDELLAARCRGPLMANFAEVFRTIVTRGVQRGQLPADTDVELLADVAPALVRYRRQLSGRPLDEALIERIADQFFRVPA